MSTPVTVTSTGAVHGRYTLGPDNIWRDYDGAEIATCTADRTCIACPRPADTYGQSTEERAYMARHGITLPPLTACTCRAPHRAGIGCGLHT